MESELSSIFRVKLVTRNIVRGSAGTQFMHMSVKMKNLTTFTEPFFLTDYTHYDVLLNYYYNEISDYAN